MFGMSLKNQSPYDGMLKKRMLQSLQQMFLVLYMNYLPK